MQKYFYVFLSVLLLCLAPGCSNNPKATAQLIKRGVSVATAIGFTAVPNKEEAAEIARQLKVVLNEDVIPLLKGDEEGLINGLDQILNLEIFDKYPKLSKAKTIILVYIPILYDNIPSNLLEKGINKVPPDVLSYIKAFFNGVLNGVESYLGESRELVKGEGRELVNFSTLRDELSK
jgi:hypothetical protein